MSDRRPRQELLMALARCIETLCAFALIDTMGAISTALEQDDRVWDYLSYETMELLESIGFERTN